jgi:hypothetical protein
VRNDRHDVPAVIETASPVATSTLRVALAVPSRKR